MTVHAHAATRGGAVAALLAGLLLLTGCGAGSAPMSGDAEPGRTLTVVASTDVWGDIVSSIAGPGVQVDSIIKDPNADPHSYESTPSDAAALTRADLIVWNGGGYDDFVQRILDSEDAKGKAVEAFALRGDQADENEHVWFDLAAVKGVIAQVTDRLAAIEPAQGDALRQRAAAVTAQLDGETAKLAAIGQARPGSRVISTEPIAHYLLTSAAVADVTPPEFVEAVEAENDPPVAAVAATQGLVGVRQVGALVFNPQTESPVTEQVRTSAEQAGVPVVDITETLPAGVNYLQWLDGNRAAFARALGAPA